MGGCGSTRWSTHTKKRTTENCLILDVNRLVKHGIGSENMTRTFWCSGTIDQHIYFEFINLDGDRPVLILEALHGEPFNTQTINFRSSAGTYGGLRWWFECATCKRRVGKLYLPGRGERFSCRHCHELSYESAQTAHQYDRRKDELGKLGQDVAMIKSVDRAFERFNRYQRHCKGKVAAFVEYLQLIEKLGNVSGM